MPFFDSFPQNNRKTKQREVILTLFEKMNRPLRLQEIHQLAQKEIPALGIATVYRTLRILQETGFLKVVYVPGSEPCYEKEGQKHHHHFQCRQCGCVFDLEECPVKLDLAKLKHQGFLPEEHELTVFGICPNCLEKGKDS